MRKTILWIFVLALSVRAIIAILQMTYGINNGINLDQYLYGPFNPGFEIYHDFYYYYVTQLAELSKGLIPYTQIPTYAYPPLFLYSLYPFYLLGGSFSASIPIWLTDAATAPLVYLVARHFTSSKLSFIAGASYAISPFFLLYEGYLWFSSQPMTFFVILSFYLLIKKRPIWASAVFAIAVLFKQEVIFVFPIYLIWLYTRFGRPIFFRGLIITCSIILAVSVPFLLISPGLYLYVMSYGVIPSSVFASSHLSNSNTISQITSPLASSTSLSCSTISNTWRSLICNYGDLTYTDSKFVASWTTIFSASFMNLISTWIFVPLLAVTSYNFIRLRKDPSILLLSASLISTTMLALFSYQVHPIYRYYLLPVYVMPLVVSRSRLSMSLAITLPLVSLIFPSGFAQLLFPLLDCLTVVLFNQKSTVAVENGVVPFSSPTMP